MEELLAVARAYLLLTDRFKQGSLSEEEKKSYMAVSKALLYYYQKLREEF